MHNRMTLPWWIIWIISLVFAQTLVASTQGDDGKDSTSVRDSLRILTSLRIRPTISDIEIFMPKSNPLRNTASPDGAMIHIVNSTTEKRNTSCVSVPAHLILESVEKNKIAIQSLYEKFLRRDRFLKGKITLAIVFDVYGIVRSIEIIQNTTRNTLFAVELSHHVRRWIMPKVNMGNNFASAVHTFVFG